ncbi:MAG TPA: hypothetical protein VK081_11225, partial [Planctomycetota bacterium]|nr:hypothetical protein [Planctomycetota bacterium]
KELPKGFQRAEFLLEKGQIDRIVSRDKMRDELARLMAYATGRNPVEVVAPPKAKGSDQPANDKAAPPAESPGKADSKSRRKKDKLAEKTSLGSEVARDA